MDGETLEAVKVGDTAKPERVPCKYQPFQSNKKPGTFRLRALKFLFVLR